MENCTNNDSGLSPMQKKDCFFFVQYGMCSFGMNCRFNHPSREDSSVVQEGKTENMYANYTQNIPCKFYHAGFCKYGSYCDFNHSMPNPPLQYNSDGLPMRMGEPLCTFYMRNYRCDYGAGCKFHHPELYFVPQEYGSHAFYEGHEYHDGLFESTDGGCIPISATRTPNLLPDYAHNENQ